MWNMTKRSFMAGTLLACFALPVAGQAQEKIRIGMTVSSSGNFALASQSGVRGVEIWVDEVNANGGLEVNGEKRLIELVKRDDRSDKQMVARVYET